jgi:membrane-associated protease RseP (regulator of RpoE activity)
MTSKIESIAYLIGMALIIFLVVISTLNDIKSLLF